MAPPDSARDFVRSAPTACHEYAPLPEAADEPYAEYGDAVPGLYPNGVGLSEASSMDMLHFASSSFFGNEEGGNVAVEVMRIGNLQGQCSVSYRTMDGSAVIGRNYIAAAGVLHFRAGETIKQFSVELVDDPAFDTTLSFSLELHLPRGCRLESHLRKVPVYILDDHYWPSQKYSKEIDDPDIESLLKVSWGLLAEFFMYTFQHVPQVKWKSIAFLVLDQLRNAYYLATIFMRVYLIDVILNLKDSETDHMLLIPGSRGASAVVLAVLFTAPNILITLIDRCFISHLGMGFGIRHHYRVNAFRQFLDLSEEKRFTIGNESILVVAGSDIPQIVENAYLGFFEMFKDLGKIGCVTFFILHSHPDAILPCLLFPAAILLYMRQQHEAQVHIAHKAVVAQTESQRMLSRTCGSIDVIHDFEQTRDTTYVYDDMLKSQRNLTLDLEIMNFWNGQFVPLLTALCIGVFMGLGAFEVLSGEITVGTFLATLNVYADLGARFGGVQSRLNAANSAIEPLLDLVQLLNMPTEISRLKGVTERNRHFMRDCMGVGRECEGTVRGVTKQLLEDIPMVLLNLTVKHIPGIQRFRATVQAGSIVSVFGAQGSGKSHLLKILTSHEKPSGGHVLHPPFQSVLQVCHTPELMEYLNLFDNLRFGSPPDLGRGDRVREIFKRLTCFTDNHWLIKQLDEEIFGEVLETAEDVETGGSQGKKPWYARLSSVEKKMIHIARAFVVGPHVIVLHKPFDDLEDHWALRILGMVEDLVRDDRGDLRKRTAFISVGTRHMRDLISKRANLELVVDHDRVEVGRMKTMQQVRAEQESGQQANEANEANSCMPFFNITTTLSEKQEKLLPEKVAQKTCADVSDRKQKKKEESRQKSLAMPSTESSGSSAHR